MPQFLSQINWVDVVFAILLLGAAYKGSRVGVGGQIVSLTSWFFLVFLAIRFYGNLAEVVFGFILLGWARPLAFLVISAGVYLLIKLLERLFNAGEKGELVSMERVCGAGIAMLKGFMLLGIVSILLILSPIPFARKALVEDSKTGMVFVNMDVSIYSWASKTLGLKDRLEKEEILEEIKR